MAKVKFSMNAIMRSVGTMGLNNSELEVGEATLKLESPSTFLDEDDLPVSYSFQMTVKEGTDVITSFISVPTNSLLAAYVEIPENLALKAGDKSHDINMLNNEPTKTRKVISMPVFLNRYSQANDKSTALGDLTNDQDFFDEFETIGTIPVMETSKRYIDALTTLGVEPSEMFRFPLRAYAKYESIIEDKVPDENGRYDLKVEDYGKIYSSSDLIDEFSRAPEFANKRLVIKFNAK